MKRIFNKRMFSTCTVFVIGVAISYFLSDRFNNVTDQRKVDFTRAQSETLFNDIETELKNDERGNMLTSVMKTCLLYTSPSPRDRQKSRMPSSA